MTDRELMRQALEALELLSQAPVETALDYADNAIDALRLRLAQPEPDGLSWLKKDSNYFSQPKRKPLTEEELADLWYKQSTDWMEFARAIEAAHGIKGEA